MGLILQTDAEDENLDVTSTGIGSSWLRSLGLALQWPGEGWFVYFRIYGVKQEFLDRKWVMNDFERVN